MSDLPGATCRVQGYRIPPVSAIDLARIVMQKSLHLFSKGLLVINGGSFFPIYDPNISLIIEKPVE